MSTEAQNVDTEGSDATETDRVNTGALGTLTVVSLLSMIAITTAVTALVRHDMEEEEATKDADSNAVVLALKSTQRGVLNAPASYVDRGKGVVSLPIDIAKQLVVSELERDPNSATPAAVTAGAASPSSGAAPAAGSETKPDQPGKAQDQKKGAGAKPETVKELNVLKRGAPGTAVPKQPSSPPLTPTAASPGAKSPGPLQH